MNKKTENIKKEKYYLLGTERTDDHPEGCYSFHTIHYILENSRTEKLFSLDVHYTSCECLYSELDGLFCENVKDIFFENIYTVDNDGYEYSEIIFTEMASSPNDSGEIFTLQDNCSYLTPITQEEWELMRQKKTKRNKKMNKEKKIEIIKNVLSSNFKCKRLEKNKLSPEIVYDEIFEPLNRFSSFKMNGNNNNDYLIQNWDKGNNYCNCVREAVCRIRKDNICEYACECFGHNFISQAGSFTHESGHQNYDACEFCGERE